ncbi:hypothetical protein [Acaryochloris marina]|uniref:hypothetical protein n=1 Tax=Acaryochloris marina TaxID=155978 RepID=UPI001BB03AF0|nr:hypothetical protein [Acaryochloris marina]QUY40422.1 hypothetical protein I1H34_00720 [Acaryochloris marina S15]
MKTITRRQLRDLGASQYQAVKITKNIQYLNIKGLTYFYNISEVIKSISLYKKLPRTKNTTIRSLENLEINIQNKYKIIEFKKPEKPSLISQFYSNQEELERKFKSVGKMLESIQR